MNKLLTSLLVFIFIILSNKSNAENYNFNHITTNDGLTQSEVYSFLKDSKGYMWFGTVHGLNSFDSYTITQYMANNTNEYSLLNNTVRALAEDDFGRIWVGTDFGLNYYERDSRKFKSINLPSEIHPICTSSLLYKDSVLYVGSNYAFYSIDMRYGSDSLSISTYKINSLNGEHRINEIAFSNNIFYLGATNGVTALSINKELQARFIDLPNALSTSPCESVLNVNSGKLLFGGYGKFMMYNQQTNKLSEFEFNLGEVSSMVSDKEGYIWVGTNYNGLYKLRINEEEIKIEHNFKKNINHSNGISSNLITSLYISNDDILWIGTIGNGIDYIKLGENGFNNVGIPNIYQKFSPSTSFVRSVFSRSSDIYIGLHSNGLIRYDRLENTYSNLGLNNKPIFHISEFNDNKLLLCSGGIYEVNAENEIKSIPGINSTCFYAVKGEDDIYWIASYSGLYRMDTKYKPYKIEKCDFTKNHTQHNNNCRVLYYDNKKSNLWVGTEGGGLYLLNINESGFPSDVIHFDSKNSKQKLSNPFIRSLYMDMSGNLWIGTYDGLNVLYYSKGGIAIERNYKREYLPNNVIQGIVGDSNNNIWISSNGGLTQIPSSGQPITYTIQDGLLSNEFSEHATYISNDGELFFGGIKGVSYFNPYKLKTNNNFHDVTITELSVRNWETKQISYYYDTKEFENGKTLELKPNEKELKIEFSAMIFDAPMKIKYRYKLIGYDKEWKYTDYNNRIIQYTNLSPGKYTLILSATNKVGVWDEHLTKINIFIQTPLLLRPFFLILYVILIILLLYIISKYNITRNTKRKHLELENEHNKRLHELDMLRTRFFVNMSHDLRTPLTLIIGPIEQIIKNEGSPEYMLSKAKQAYKSAKKLNYMVEQLLDFRKIEIGKEKVQLNRIDFNKWLNDEISYFIPTIEEKGLKLNTDFRCEQLEILLDCKKVAKIIFNLMSNAIKFTTLGHITVSYKIDKYQKTLSITIEDTGKGIDPNIINKIFDRYYTISDTNNVDGYGIGLSYCQDLSTAMNGNLSVISKLGEGSSFTLELPLLFEKNYDIDNIMEVCNPQTLTKEKVINTVPDVYFDNNKKTILIIDDNDEMREYIKELLQDYYNIYTAQSANKGIEIAENFSIDLILSDVMMPGMNGIDFTQAIKSNITISHIPVILLTAKTEIETILSGFSSGADDYIPKPFDSQILLAKISSILDNRERIRKAFQKELSLDKSFINLEDKDTEFLNKVISIIESNIENSEFSIDNLEKEMCMSHSKFFRKLKSLTGMSGKDLLQDIRLKRAAQLLVETNISLSDITYMTGFVDPKYFSYAFKQKYDIAPTKYREKNSIN